jgi:hypothetical protein
MVWHDDPATCIGMSPDFVAPFGLAVKNETGAA